MTADTTARQQAPLHFRRIELKYMLSDRYIPHFIERIKPYTQPDPFLVEEESGRQSYPVTSLYFDSVDLHSLYEKDAGLLARRKVRLRTYEEFFSADSFAFLEIKRRHDAAVSKDRLSLSIKNLTDKLPSNLLQQLLQNVEAKQDVTHEANLLQSWFNLQPTTLVSYHRTPFVGMQDRRFRITIDSNLRAAWKPAKLTGEQLMGHCHPGCSVIELKTNHAAPAWFHAILQEFNLNRVTHSKYALSTLALRERMSWVD